MTRKKITERLLLAAMLGMALLGCDASYSGAQPSVAAATAAAASVEPAIETTPRGLIYQGKVLDLGAPMSAWIQALGPDHRSTQPNPSLTVLVWDKLGIRVYPDNAKEPNANIVTIVLNHMDNGAAGLEVSSPGTEQEPRSVFTQSLSLQGLPITNRTTVRDLRAAGGDAWDFSCTKGVATCFTHRTDLATDQLSIAFAVDGRIENSVIYTVELQKAGQ